MELEIDYQVLASQVRKHIKLSFHCRYYIKLFIFPFIYISACSTEVCITKKILIKSKDKAWQFNDLIWNLICFHWPQECSWRENSKNQIFWSMWAWTGYSQQKGLGIGLYFLLVLELHPNCFNSESSRYCNYINWVNIPN